MTLKDFLREGSQRKFALRIGYSRSAVCRWINGERVPSTRAIMAIVRETNGRVTANDFITDAIKSGWGKDRIKLSELAK